MHWRTGVAAAAAVSVVMMTLAAGVARGEVPGVERVREELAGPYAAVAATVPAERRGGEVSRRVERLMGQQARFLLGQLKPWEKDADALLLTDGRSGEHGIRPNAHTILGLAVMARYGVEGAGGVGGPTPAEARAKAVAMLRFVLPTHGAGGQVCADGKPWRNQWQSALWAYEAGIGAWLLWDELDEEMRWLAARMIQDEADRFVGKTPPAQVERDTKAEENAWNAQVVALAYNLFPRHPNRAAWGETAKRWQVSSFATSADLQRENPVDGRPVREWLTGANIYDDYTLENHDRVHPDYMSTITINLLQTIVYDWGGNEPTQAMRWNAERVYAGLKRMCFADGGFVYANAQDWHLHRNADWFDLHVTMAVLFDDRQAARLMRVCLETAERMAGRDPRGGVYAPGETAFASSQAMMLAWPAKAHALMARRGEGPEPVSEVALWRQVAGRHVFEAGKFGMVRTDRSVATFSWGQQVMGQVLPLQKDLLLTPCDRGLIGVVRTEGGDRPVVREVRVAPSEEWLGVAGVLERGGGAMEQRFGYAALADGRVVWVDACRLTGKGRVAGVTLGTIGVLNDRKWAYHDGTRTVYFEGGERTFAAAEARKDSRAVAMASPWVNVDGRLGIVNLGGGRAVYEPAPTAAAGRLEQLFHLNSVDEATLAAAAGAGEGRLPETVLVFYPGQAAERTGQVAGRCRVEREGSVVRVTLEDGAAVAFDLADQTVEVTGPGR